MCEYCQCDPCQCEVLCPCGCENRFDENCVYDTPLQRHVKNLINVLDDEQWVIDGMKAAQQNAHLTPESLETSQAVSNALALSKSDGDTPPAQAQVA
jgi:hypothetical protein